MIVMIKSNFGYKLSLLFEGDTTATLGFVLGLVCPVSSYKIVYILFLFYKFVLIILEI